MKVKARNVGDGELSAPGDYQFRSINGEVLGMGFVCPCGCGNESWLPVTEPGPVWAWDGNVDAPTLTPSILNRFCKYHGFLTNGVFESC